MSDKSCNQCKYKGVTFTGNKEIIEVCRFNPPTVVGALMMSATGPSWTATTVYPAINGKDWCGQYAPTLIGLSS